MRRKTQREQDEYDMQVHRASIELAQKVRSLMSATRCKFRVESVTKHVGGQTVEMLPVYGDSPENKTFWKATPSGSLKFTYINENIEFKPGDEHYIDITLAKSEPKS